MRSGKTRDSGRRWGFAPGRLALAAAAVSLTLLQPGEEPALADASLPIFNGGGSFGVTVKSFSEQKFNGVVRQKHDISCGSAAVATLLTYHYETPTTEESVFSVMYNTGDKAKIQSQGFSLLEMKAYLESQGLRAEGYRVPLDKLNEAKIPAIVLTNTGGYQHFVVVKGVTQDKILVADPALGNRIVPRAEFEAVWNGMVFILLDNTEIAKDFYNAERQWQIRQKAPVAQGRATDSIGLFSLTLPGPGFF